MSLTSGQHCAGVGCAHDPSAGTPDGTPLHLPRFDPRHIRSGAGRHGRVVMRAASGVEPVHTEHAHDRDALLG